MKKLFFVIFLLVSVVSYSQLTVEKIMRDPKWMGTSPSNIGWSYNSKGVYFQWNPKKATSDSAYKYELNSAAPVKTNYKERQIANAVSNAAHNKPYTQLVYEYKGDVYWLDVAANKTIRVTQTTDYESAPIFVLNDEAIAYQKGNDIFEWEIKTGITKQITDFEKDSVPAKKPSAEEKFLQQQQLATSDIIKERKEKKDKRKAYLDAIKDKDTLHIIYSGDKEIQSVQTSPDTRFISYVLYEPAVNEKSTIVPSYVTESGYTTDIPGRTNVGTPQGKSEWFVLDRLRDTLQRINTDSLPGITEKPLYMKDYPAKFKDTPVTRKAVYLSYFDWNETGSAAVADIRSVDNKDRWLMQFDTATKKIKLIDHQHDEAWIGGPGVGWESSDQQGWINDHVYYFQSEVTGYSHLYSFDVTDQTKKELTQGNYEIQQVTPSRDKKYFYIVSNEEHPGKQNFYRINVDGTNKQKITSMTGGYEVSISPDEKYIAYRYSYQNKPWELYIQENAPGKKPQQVTDKAMSDEFKSYAWRDTKIIPFTARDGAQVYARIYEPSEGKKNNAAVIFVHGAGYLQNVDYWWSYYYHEFMFNNLLADKGYTVIDIDYRASAGYGRDWRTGIYRYMGGKDLDDEVDAAKFLVKEYGIDSTRIGIYGGSYGGFMTLMALFTKPSVFKAGAALRPVTDWSHYNHGYTSAILNEPFNDSIAYQRSSPINFTAGLQNHLLICHGMVDENVHFQDAVRLSQRLIELGKNNWELAAYPVEDHGFVEASSWTDEYKRILKLFDDNLLK